MTDQGFWIDFVPDDENEDLAGNDGWLPEEGNSFKSIREKTYGTLERISSSPETVKTAWLSDVKKVAARCKAPKLFGHQDSQLVYGRVQAGKTSNFTGVISLLSDNNYDLFIVIAGINLNLRDQTFDRLKKDLKIVGGPGFEVIRSDPRQPETAEATRVVESLKKLHQPSSGGLADKFRTKLIYVVLKEITHLTWLNNFLKVIGESQAQYEELYRTNVLIIDDETDQASPDGFENRDDKSSAIHEALSNLRRLCPTHTYLGYTATPYANLLMTEHNRLKCEVISVLDAGPDYVGPESLFQPSSEDQTFYREITDWAADRESIAPSLVQAFATFVVQSAIMNSRVDVRSIHLSSPLAELDNEDITPCSMLVHASQRVNDASKIFKELTSLRSNWISAVDSEIGPNGIRDSAYVSLWREVLEPACREFYDEDSVIPPSLMQTVETVLRETDIREINGAGKAQGFVFPSEEEFASKPAWVLIGGQLLDRGQTLPTLINTYMPRPPGGSAGNTVRGQFDTLQQRGRFYGQRGQYRQLLRGWFDGDALNTYQKLGILEPENIEVLTTLEGAGLALSKLPIVFELMGKLNLTRANVIPKDVFSVNSAKWLFRQTHFDSETQSKNNLQTLSSVIEKVGQKAFITVDASRRDNFQNYKAVVQIDDLIELISLWEFSGREQKTKDVAITLLQKFKQAGSGTAEILLMSRPVNEIVSQDNHGEYRTASEVEYVDQSNTKRTTTKITGLTSSNDAKFISDDMPSVQVHFLEMKTSAWSRPCVGLAIAFPRHERLMGRIG